MEIIRKKDDVVEVFVGKKEIGDYVYYAFKELTGRKYRIAQKNVLTNAWEYIWGTGGLAEFEDLWADPSILDYSLPPDA